VKFGFVLGNVGKVHATSASVTSPPFTDAFETLPFDFGGVVEVGWGGDADACEGSAGGVAGG